MAGKSKLLNAEKSKSIELQGKRKVDDAWHDCEVSLSSADPSSTSLNVHFMNLKNDENNVILRKEEAFACLRVRSTNLSNGECVQVKEGEEVLALQKTRTGRHYFFDAEVEKVKRLKHSNKVFCRCTFEIRWLESELKGERVTVPASSIKRLVQESIEDHPIVAAFFEAVESAKQSSLSPELPGGFRDDSVVESDIHALLEQQIEEITKLAETSENATTEERSSKNKRVNSKQIHENVNSLVERTRYGKDSNGSVPPRKSLRKGKVVSSEKVEGESVSLNVATLLHLENRPRLSPLAARAALAAAVWDLPLDKERTDNVHEGKDRDSIGPISQNLFRDQLDKVSLNLSDTYLDIKHHNKGSRVPKTAKSIARGKSSKQSSSNKLYANKDHDGRTNTKSSQVVSSDHSRLKRTYSASVAAKQEASSDIASTAKESSAMTDANVPSTEQSIRKRQRGASKEVNSTRSKSRHLGAVPTRSSPRFHVAPVSDKEETSRSLHNRETENNEPTASEDGQREINGFSAATRFNVRKPKMDKKPSDLSEQDPEEDTNGAITEGSKDSGYGIYTSDKVSLEAKKIKRAKVTTSNHVKQPLVTNGTAENSVGTVEERFQSKRASKPSTSSVKSSKTNISPTYPEISDGGDKMRQKSRSRKMSSAEEGENSKRGRASADKNLKAQRQVGSEMKEHTSRGVVTRSSPHFELLPQTRTRSQYQKITQK
ncbi:hypothetical protein SUGI_0845720 [Cryptomeria japonica]|uniref:uncharacterized protein LOC131034949 isoform X2 n=1 Tax=Cryptomeria japonica TaxID=3369 RepID=UPI0024146F66|nr:uncharacterized protein LOC131034949 isoform X2 [Cryptomeria japonica]GLJ40882.1 hypothetical protein SUGI_0845720 [Cryptomeria japonica]